MLNTIKILKAIKFATKTHEVYQKQKRKGKDIAYITHPLIVGLILSQAKASEEAIVAGILHDTIEDSPDEKKVTGEMIEERFGKKVAQEVLSVTETDRSLSWEERKKQALEHIQTFSQDSLLIKSADIIANTAELLDDYGRHHDSVFARFNASKEKILRHQLEAISLIIQKWKENPLVEDLNFLASRLQMIGAVEFMSQYPTKIIEYKDYDENAQLECPVCHWKGSSKESGIAESEDCCLTVSCPICAKMILKSSFSKELK